MPAVVSASSPGALAAGIVALNAITIATGQRAVQISLRLTLTTLIVTILYPLGYRGGAAAVRGRWGLSAGE
jgi:hypothetical protein